MIEKKGNSVMGRVPFLFEQILKEKAAVHERRRYKGVCFTDEAKKHKKREPPDLSLQIKWL